MSIPHLDETRKRYIERSGENHLEAAKRHCELGNDLSMWIQLFTWAQREEIYGEHWDNWRNK